MMIMIKKYCKAVIGFILAITCFILGATTLAFADTQKTAISCLDAYKVVHWWDASPSWTTQGAKMTIEGNTTGTAWNKGGKINWDNQLNHIFDVSKGQSVDIKFKLNLVEADAKSNNGDKFDILVKSGTEELIRLRVYFAAGGVANGSHSVELYALGAWTNLVADTWIYGDASLASEFHIAFSKENLLMAGYNGDTTLRSIDTSGKLKLALAEKLPSINNISFDIVGDNGFNKNVDLIVTEINGQSLANDGINFTNDIAPIIVGSMVSEISTGEEYVLPIIAADLFVKEPEIIYNIDFRTHATTDYTYVPGEKKFTINKGGEYTIVVTAQDLTGNISEPKTFSFTAVEEILAPVISNLPIIENKTVSKGETMIFDLPTITETTGSYELKIIMYDAGNNEILRTGANDVSGKFAIQVPYALETGNYNVAYEASNRGGSTLSEKTLLKITVNTYYASDLVGGVGMPVNTDSAPLVDYIATGIRIRTPYNWNQFSIGKEILFDARVGREIVFTIPKTCVNGYANNIMTGRMDFVIFNPIIYDSEASPSGSLDESGNIVENYAKLGVWGGTGSDRPTNIYVKTPASGQYPLDISDTGWIKTNENDTQITFRMKFDYESYFTAERQGGMIQSANDKDANLVKNAIDALVAKWNTNFLAGGICAGKSGDANNFEIIINSVDGIMLNNTNGIIGDIPDAKIIANKIPSIVKNNIETMLDINGYDFFGGNKLKIKITAPDSSVINIENAYNYIFTPTILGDYIFEYDITGQNGKKVILDSFTISVKDLFEELILTVDGVYQGSCNAGESLKILALKANDKIASVSIKMVLQDNTETIVKVGDSYKFVKPGVYKLIYTAYDKALPSPTIFTKEVVFNANDLVAPIVKIGDMTKKVKIGEKAEIGIITVTDDSDYNIIVKIISPSGAEEKLAIQDGKYCFTPNEKGTYKVQICVIDDYDNKKIENIEVVVTGIEGCSSVISFSNIIFMIIAMLLLLGISRFSIKKASR